MSVLFICYPKCSTCVKARKWLEENGVEFTERNITTENPTKAELTEWVKTSGLPLKRFYNTSGMIYRQMDLKNKIPVMSEEEQYDLLSSNGMIVKRPLLIGKDFVLVGFREAEWKEKLI